ncbi:LTA synthase family protein [Pedobacter sp. MW01-1-1]|uniref:LTA synthase family protein n=1 Tax=Pedobacter sp. MW01-1-1 TaxID=3383027 RepID=UPI003FEDDCB8
MIRSLFKSRYAALYAYALFFVFASLMLRLSFLCLSFSETDLTIKGLAILLAKGFIFDCEVAIYLTSIYSVYLLLVPQKFNHTTVNKVINYVVIFILILVAIFAFFAEITFWNEFKSRFNFIAVDYLIYTYEVVNNINQSYPLYYLIPSIIFISIGIQYLLVKTNTFKNVFVSNTRFKFRCVQILITICLLLFDMAVLKNVWAEKTENRYQNELSKAGIYSFFSAFKSNELNYNKFYYLIDKKEAFKIVKDILKDSNSTYIGPNQSIRRKIKSTNNQEELRPNVMMVVIESFSASFMQEFGSNRNLTPVLDTLVSKSILFSNMYATGTRTVRGMEALSLALPPTPGNSIVKREKNAGLSTIGSIFRSKEYNSTFFYGGDGYFDNMNQFFGSNGFDIVDRGRKITIGDSYKTNRKTIPDSIVTFENAWGVCDENLYTAVIRDADEKFSKKQPFYNFIMTTSNHRPFTYPSNKIDIASGTSREGAVKYTDYAIGQFLKEARKKAWFSNTVFIFIADHCDSSAGKNEIDVSKYHIPAMIYNLPNQSPFQIDKICSQIDLYPTLFSLLNWSYQSNNYGKNVLNKDYSPRTLISTYQKLGYMKNDSLILLSPQQKVESMLYKRSTNQQIKSQASQNLIKEALSHYQTAFDLYSTGGLKE